MIISPANSSANKVFHFKQFSVHQGECGMPVSTDGVLLGAWFKAQSSSQILDVGCGTGLLSLMAAQRFNQATITGIDIEQSAIHAAKLNVERSPWSQRINIDQQNILALDGQEKFDIIVCNPPYFTSGETAQNSARATARHTSSSFTHQTLMDCCATLLKHDGYANFILPTQEAEAMIKYAQIQGWQLTRCWEIQSTTNKPISRILFELTQQNAMTTEKGHLTIHKNGGYSDKFIHLTQAFYLKM